MTTPLRLKIGADPELFVRDKKTGLYVSAHNLMPGTKESPHKVDLGAIQVDGVAAEFNIDPTESAQQFVTNITAVTGQLKKIVGDGYELVSEPTCTFAEDYFKSLPETVRELGCNPDYNAWTGQVNVKPDGDVTTMRTGAGHIHLGWTENADPTDDVHFEDCRIVAKQLDNYLGLYSLMWDDDTKRRTLYGKAGSFRAKPYGMEYRPLSNQWLATPRLQSWVWNAAYRGFVDLVQNGNRIEDKLGDITQRFIDGNENWWGSSAGKKSADHMKVAQLPLLTGLENPPIPPKPKPVEPDAVKPKAKHYYGTKRHHLSSELGVALEKAQQMGHSSGNVKYSPSNGLYYVNVKIDPNQ